MASNKFLTDITVDGNADITGRLDVASDLRLRGSSSSIDQGVVRLYADSGNHLYIDTGNNGAQVYKFGADGSLTLSSSNSQGLTIKQSADLGADMQVEIRGSRNAPSAGVNPAKLILSSYDSDDGSGVVKTGAEFYMESTSLTGGDLSDFEVGLRYRKDGSVVDGLSIHDGQITAHGTLKITGYGAGILKTDSSGNVNVDTNTYITASGAVDTDAYVEIGRAHVGAMGHTDYAGFSHIDQNGTGSYALLQSATGATFLNSASGKNIHFRTANSDKMVLTGAGNLGIGTTSPGAKLEINVSGATNQLLLTQGSTDHMGLVAGTNGGGIIVEDNNFFSIWHQDYANRGTETGITERFRIDTSGNVGIGTASPSAPLDVRASSYKVIRLGNDITSHYTFSSGTSDNTLTLTCGSYYQAEVVITANQTNSGGYNNWYVRGLWSNNHTTHHWDILEEVGYLTGSDFSFTNGQNDVENSGKLVISHTYNSGSFGGMTVRVTDMYGSHSYSIS